MYDGERQLFIEVQEGYKVFCVKRYEHFVHLLGGQYLFEILRTSPTVLFFSKMEKACNFFFFFCKNICSINHCEGGC